jgi:hypothetical protein
MGKYPWVILEKNGRFMVRECNQSGPAGLENFLNLYVDQGYTLVQVLASGNTIVNNSSIQREIAYG